MLCMECGANADKGYTTDVTDLGNCLVIVRNVPCYKCTECNEIIYTADVIKRLEGILEQAKKMMQEIAIIDYGKAAQRACGYIQLSAYSFLANVLVFLYEFFSIPIVGHDLQDYYPISAGLSIIDKIKM